MTPNTPLPDPMDDLPPIPVFRFRAFDDAMKAAETPEEIEALLWQAQQEMRL